MNRTRKKISLAVLVIISLLVIYIIWDNHRFIVVEQEIEINQLPEQMEGFRILQISDLHEKQFGENQEKLINLINSIEYDVIVFTGDMLDSKTSKNYDTFYNLIEGI